MAIKDKNGNWIDGRGKSVPVKYISKTNKERDKLVEKLIKKADKIHKQIANFKQDAHKAIGDFIAFSEKESGISPGGTKGNLTLSNFSKDKQVEVNIHEKIDFDERLQQAKKLIYELLDEWSTDARKELKLVVAAAFDTNKKGRVDEKAILNLRQLQIKDKKWKKAMDLIDNSRTVFGAKSYIRFKVRKGSEGKFKTIVLDIAGIEVD